MIQGNEMMKQAFAVPPDLLDDIASRFLLDAPEFVLIDPIPLCFLTEQAYWFYLDEYLEEDESLNALKQDAFVIQLLKHVKIKPPKGGTLENMLQKFREFKQGVPTYGGLLLNAELSHVLLVQGFLHKDSWSFPKGKINVDEEPHKCAIREVMEETGYDISDLMNPNEFVETTMGEQKSRLYIIRGVPMETEFMPKTKGEIKELKWFPVHQLPTHKNDRSSSNLYPFRMMYMVMPFIKSLREWINSTLGRVNRQSEGRKRHKSLNSGNGNIEILQRSTNHSPMLSRESHRKYIQQGPLMLLDLASPQKHSFVVSHQLKEGKTNSRGKSETQDDTHRKFTFRSLGKNKPHQNLPHAAANNKPNLGMHSNSASNIPHFGMHSPVDSSTIGIFRGFSSYSWKSFKINRRVVNEALDKVWNDVYLALPM